MKKWEGKTVLKLGQDTGLYLIDDFLSSSECAILKRMATHKGLEGNVFSKPADRYVKFIKTEEVTRAILDNNHSKTVFEINKRIERFTGFPIENGEGLKVVNYKKGGYFNPHTDYVDKFPKYTKNGRRVAQMLLYLNEVEEGGETNFPNIGIQVCPKEGRALFWFGIVNPAWEYGHMNLPKVFKKNHYAIHEPLEVLKGEKWIAAKLLHNLKFDVKYQPVAKI